MSSLCSGPATRSWTWSPCTTIFEGAASVLPSNGATVMVAVDILTRA